VDDGRGAAVQEAHGPGELEDPAQRHRRRRPPRLRGGRIPPARSGGGGAGVGAGAGAVHGAEAVFEGAAGHELAEDEERAVADGACS
jgi:hypothetical protein